MQSTQQNNKTVAMSLYEKKLSGIDALRMEKLQLQAKADLSLKSAFYTPGAKAAPDASGNSDPIDTIFRAGMDFFTSKGFLRKAIALGMPLLDILEIKLEKKIILSASKEVLGGYIKWKAIEIGLSAVSSYIENNWANKDND